MIGALVGFGQTRLHLELPRTNEVITVPDELHPHVHRTLHVRMFDHQVEEKALKGREQPGLHRACTAAEVQAHLNTPFKSGL